MQLLQLMKKRCFSNFQFYPARMKTNIWSQETSISFRALGVSFRPDTLNEVIRQRNQLQTGFAEILVFLHEFVHKFENHSELLGVWKMLQFRFLG